jgi:carbon-monoxide dehydrogenase small subunit
VFLDGDAVNACLVYAVECAGRSVETIEHVAEAGIGALVAAAFSSTGAIQCGVCTPGFVVAATDLLTETQGQCTRGEVATALGGNLCRCTGYLPIVDAVLDVAAQLREGAPT